MNLTDPVLISTALLGLVAGVVGSFAVLRKRALMGDLLSHTALPGLCVAFLIMGQAQFTGMLWGALISGLIGVAAVIGFCRWSRTKEDAAIGIVLSTFFGLGVVLQSLITHSPTGGKAGISHYIYGQAAGISSQDMWLIAGVSAFALLVVLACYKEFKLFSFDPEFTRTQGWPTGLLEVLLTGTLAVVTVVGLSAVGVILMAAMLITPGAAARFWVDRLGKLLVLAGIIGGATGLIGSAISAGLVKQWLGFDPLTFGYNDNSLPTGPVIVLVGAAIFLFSLFFAPRRGVFARLWEVWRLQIKTRDENLLRTFYELSEGQRSERPLIPREMLMRDRAWSPAALQRELRRAGRRGWIEATDDGYSLQFTSRGLEEARRVTRAHRLWELFLIEGANIAADHVDRDADALEHFLPPEMLDRLEAKLMKSGRWPARRDALPESPHELSPAKAEEGNRA